MASLAPPAARSDARTLPLAGFKAVLLLWAGYSILRLLALPVFNFDPTDPDDFLRMMQVHDLLAGQGWYDVRQYRIDPPVGADMHWSRIVDVPLAAVALLLGLVMESAHAEFAAMVVVPLAYLGVAMILLRAIMQRLGLSEQAIFLGLCATLLFPLVQSNFAPLRVDHHTPQALCALGCLLLLLHAPSRKAALGSGALSAVWLCISLEALPQVAALAALYGLRYLTSSDRSLGWYLAGLAALAPVLSLATRLPAELLADYCDILRPGHMAAFGVATLIAAGLPYLPMQDRIGGRLAGLCVLPAATIPIVLGTIGTCALDPFANITPLMRDYWYNYVLEGLPFWQVNPSQAAMAVWTVLIVPAGWLVARRTGLAQLRWEDRWTDLAIIALLMGAFSLLLLRASFVAQLFAVPFSGVLIWHFLPKARAMPNMLARVGATVGCFVLATPVLASASGKPLDDFPLFDPLWQQADDLRSEYVCEIDRLAALPAGHMYTTLDLGPAIIAKTDLTVMATGHHRNAERITEVIDTFSGDPVAAQRRIDESGADYVMMCLSGLDGAFYRTRREDNLANAIGEGNTPGWLEPVQGFQRGPLRVFRVK